MDNIEVKPQENIFYESVQWDASFIEHWDHNDVDQTFWEYMLLMYFVCI